MKKLLATLLALVMVLALCVPTFAETYVASVTNAAQQTVTFGEDFDPAETPTIVAHFQGTVEFAGGKTSGSFRTFANKKGTTGNSSSNEAVNISLESTTVDAIQEFNLSS